MSTDTRIFRQFMNEAQARQVTDLLDAAGITYAIQNERRAMDAVYAGADFEPAIKLLVHASDFSRAQAALDAYYAAEVEKADPDYYLFTFTNPELLEVVAKADEWNAFDVMLAKKLLLERKAGVDEQTFSRLEAERNSTLAKKEQAPTWMLVVGYLLIAGSAYGCWTLFNLEFSAATTLIFLLVFGAFVGMHLRKSMRTLPDGRLEPVYNDNSRKQGTIIFYLSLLMLAIGFIGLMLYLKETTD